MSIVEGFGGFRIVDDVPHFKPILPPEWKSYSFKVQFRGRVLRVDVSHDFTDIILESGDSLSISLNNQYLKLNLPRHC